MEVDVVIENAIKQGFDSELVHAALVEADMDAIDTFIDELKITGFRKLMRAVIRQLLDVARFSEQAKAIDILEVLLELPHGEVSRVIAELGQIRGERALALIRRAMCSRSRFLRETAAQEIIATYYEGSNEHALQDESELVCHIAAKQLEKVDKVESLIESLENQFASVRRIAAWYMGRRRITEAVKPLIALIQTETDSETLRAAIWSLGVLRDKAALPHIQKLSLHPDSQIAVTVQDALSKFKSESGEGATR